MSSTIIPPPPDGGPQRIPSATQPIDREELERELAKMREGAPPPQVLDRCPCDGKGCEICRPPEQA